MRILLTADPILPVPPMGYGGVERIVDALVCALRRRGHTVGLVARAGSSCPADAVFSWPDNRVKGAVSTARNALALSRAVRAFRPEIVHSFSRLAYLLLLLPRRLPKIMSYQRHTGGRQLSLAVRLAGQTLRFTGCSEFICRMGRPAGGQWNAVPNFVDVARFTFVPWVPEKAPLVFLSRMDAVKGPDLAIAVARASGRSLILAGNRSDALAERQFWDSNVAPHLGPAVSWIGEVDDRQKNDLLGRAAALLVPIRWEEPFGIVFAEALACGTPLLSSRRGALPEIIEEGRTGFFLDTPAEGAKAVHRLGELDRFACRTSAETRFSLEVCSDRYCSLYREMIGSTGSNP